jgi:hypothetical protein
MMRLGGRLSSPNNSTSGSGGELLRASRVAGVFCLSAFLYWAALVWPVLPFGSEIFTALAIAYPALSVAALVVATAELIHSLKARAIRKSILAVSFAAAIVAGTAVGVLVGRWHRMERIAHVATAAMPLVRAIEAFETTEGRPPRNLGEIVPRYLTRIPSTRMGGYGEWHYITGPDARTYGDNKWVLRVHTSGPGINFDQLMYFPNQRYPQFGHGGLIERVGKWAYVHE